MSSKVLGGVLYTNHASKNWTRKYGELNKKSLILYDTIAKKKKFRSLQLKDSQVYATTYPTFTDYGDFGFTIFLKNSSYLNLCALNKEDQEEWMECIRDPKKIRKKSRESKNKKKLGSFIKRGFRGSKKKKNNNEKEENNNNNIDIDSSSSSEKRKDEKNVKKKRKDEEEFTEESILENKFMKNFISQYKENPFEKSSSSSSKRRIGSSNPLKNVVGRAKKLGGLKETIRQSLPHLNVASRNGRKKRRSFRMKEEKDEEEIVETDMVMVENPNYNAVEAFVKITKEVKDRPIQEEDIASLYFHRKEDVDSYRMYLKNLKGQKLVVDADRLLLMSSGVYGPYFEGRVYYSDRLKKYESYDSYHRVHEKIVVVRKDLILLEKDFVRRNIDVVGFSAIGREEGEEKKEDWSEVFDCTKIRALVMNYESSNSEELRFISFLITGHQRSITYLFPSLESKREFFRTLKGRLWGENNVPKIHYVNNVLFYSQHSHLLHKKSTPGIDGNETAKKTKREKFASSDSDYCNIGNTFPKHFSKEEDEKILFSTHDTTRMKSFEDVEKERSKKKSGKLKVLIITKHGIYAGLVSNKRLTISRKIVLKMVTKYTYCRKRKEEKKEEDNDDEVDGETKEDEENKEKNMSKNFTFLLLKIPVEGDLLLRIDNESLSIELIDLLQKLFEKNRGASFMLQEYKTYEAMKGEEKKNFHHHVDKQSLKKEEIMEQLKSALIKNDSVNIQYLIEKFSHKMDEEEVNKAQKVLKNITLFNKIQKDWNKNYLEYRSIRELRGLIERTNMFGGTFRPVKKWRIRKEKKVNQLRNLEMFKYLLEREMNDLNWNTMNELFERAKKYDELSDVILQFKYLINRTKQKSHISNLCIDKFIEREDLDGLRLIKYDRRIYGMLNRTEKKKINKHIQLLNDRDKEYKKLKNIIAEARKECDEKLILNDEIYKKLIKNDKKELKIVKEAEETIDFIMFYNGELEKIQKHVKDLNKKKIIKWMEEIETFDYLFERELVNCRNALEEIQKKNLVKVYKRRLNIIFKQNPIEKDMLESTVNEIEERGDEVVIEALKNQLMKAKIFLRNLNEKKDIKKEEIELEEIEMEDNEEILTKEEVNEKEDNFFDEDEIDGLDDVFIDDSDENSSSDDDNDVFMSDSDDNFVDDEDLDEKLGFHDSKGIFNFVMKKNKKMFGNENDHLKEEEDVKILYTLRENIVFCLKRSNDREYKEILKLLEEFRTLYEKNENPHQTFVRFYETTKMRIDADVKQYHLKNELDNLLLQVHKEKESNETKEEGKEDVNNVKDNEKKKEEKKYESNVAKHKERIQSFFEQNEKDLSEEMLQKTKSVISFLEKEEEELNRYYEILKFEIEDENIELIQKELERLKNEFPNIRNYKHIELNNIIKRGEELVERKLKNRNDAIVDLDLKISRFLRKVRPKRRRVGVNKNITITREKFIIMNNILSQLIHVLVHEIVIYAPTKYNKFNRNTIKIQSKIKSTLKRTTKEEENVNEILDKKCQSFYEYLKLVSSAHPGIMQNIRAFENCVMYSKKKRSSIMLIYFFEFLFDCQSILHVLYPFLFFTELKGFYKSNSILSDPRNRKDIYEVVQYLFPAKKEDVIKFGFLQERRLLKEKKAKDRKSRITTMIKKNIKSENIVFLNEIKISILNIVINFYNRKMLLDRIEEMKKEETNNVKNVDEEELQKNLKDLEGLVRILSNILYDLMIKNRLGFTPWKLVTHIKKDESKNIQNKDILMFINSMKRVEDVYIYLKKDLEEEEKRRLSLERQRRKNEEKDMGDLFTSVAKGLIVSTDQFMKEDKEKFCAFLKYSLNEFLFFGNFKIVINSENLKSKQLNSKEKKESIITLLKKIDGLKFNLKVFDKKSLKEILFKKS